MKRRKPLVEITVEERARVSWSPTKSNPAWKNCSARSPAFPKKPASFSFSDNTFAEAKVISTLHRGASILHSGFEAKMSQGDTGDTTKAERHARSLSQGSSLLELISVSMSNQDQSQSGVLMQLKKSGTAVKGDQLCEASAFATESTNSLSICPSWEFHVMILQWWNQGLYKLIVGAAFPSIKSSNARHPLLARNSKANTSCITVKGHRPNLVCKGSCNPV